MPGVERTWERLLSALNSWASATELEPGRVRVRFVDSRGSHRQAEIVMAPESWDDWVNIMWASPEDAARDVKESLVGLEDTYRFLVYEQYGLEPSETEELPPDDVLEWIRAHPEQRGRWVVMDDAGNVIDEFH